MVFQYYAGLGFLGLLMVTAFVNASAIRDFTNNTQQIMFSTPLKKGQYLLSRFLGSTFVATLPLLGITLGMLLGSVMPWVDPERLGPNDLMAHAQAYLYLSLPNILFSAAIIFAVAVLVRSTMASFISAIVLFVGYSIAGSYMSDLENQTLAALLDPFGSGAIDLLTKYWTVDQKNVSLLPMDGVLLWNRLIWIGVSILVFCYGYWRFSFTDKVRKVKVLQADAPVAASGSLWSLPKVKLDHGRRAARKQFASLYWNDLKGMVKSTPSSSSCPWAWCSFSSRLRWSPACMATPPTRSPTTWWT
jgi:ABC-2 type transport system permease protein